MTIYRVYGVVTGTKYLGEVEANTPEEAQQKAMESEECYVSVCWSCSDQVEDPEIHEVIVEEIR